MKSIYFKSGFNIGGKDSGGGTIIAGYHPRGSNTWYWSLSVQPHKDEPRKFFGLWIDRQQWPQKHHILKLFWLKFVLATQSYHKQAQS